MNRITSILGLFTLASVGATSSTSLAQVNDIELLKSRVSTLESRVIALENAAATSGVTNASFAPAPPTPVSAAPEPKSYVIKEGDTVSEIARREGIPRTLLMEENGLREGQQIYIGDRLLIPTRPGAEAPSAANIAKAPKQAPKQAPVKPAADTGGHTFYTVKYGDTLSKISRSTGASVAAIKSANGLRNDIIGGGQRLKIPTGKNSAPSTNVANNSKPAPSTPKYTNASLNDNESYGEYTVEKGDNLYALARDFFTTMKELQRINGLGSSTLIHPGHKLIVPTSKYNEYHNKVATR